MYKKIEEEFKAKSIRLRDRCLFSICIIFMPIIEIIIICQIPIKKYPLVFISTIPIVLIFYILCYLYICISVSKLNENKWYDYFKFNKIWKIYLKNTQKQDIKTLTAIIEEKGINTRSEIQEAIRHYQCLLPRKVISGGMLLSILALAISILSFIIAAQIDDIEYSIKLIIQIFTVITIFYYAIKTMNETLFKFFGKYTLFERIEAALSEIYVKYPIAKKKKTNKNSEE